MENDDSERSETKEGVGNSETIRGLCNTSLNSPDISVRMAEILQRAPKPLLEIALLDAVSALATAGIAEAERKTPAPEGMDREYMHAVVTEETLIRILRSSAAELLIALSGADS